MKVKLKSRILIKLAFTLLLLAFLTEIVEAEGISGDLIISEDTVIENKELIINGNIVVEEGNTLTIRNSEITLNSRYKNEYWIKIKSNATLVVENSRLYEGLEQGVYTTLVANEKIKLGETVIATEDSTSKLYMKNSKSELRIQVDGEVEIDSSVVGIIFWRLTGKATIRDSKIGLVHLWFTGEPEEIRIRDLRPGYNQNVNFDTAEGSFTLQDSSVGMYSLALWDIYGNHLCRKSLVVEDSELSEIFAVFSPGSDVELENMKPQYYENWNIYDNPKIENLTWNLTLKNVKLDKWKIDIQGKAKIKNSHFHLDTWGSQNDPYVEVEDSTIITLHTRGNGYMKFKNVVFSRAEKTPIRFLYNIDKYQTTKPLIVEFHDSTIGPEALIEVGRAFENESKIIFKGEVAFLIPPSEVYWFKGEISREYPVILRYGNGTPVANATLILFDDNGRIWNESTDENGKAYFEIKFTEENWKKTCMLSIPMYNLTKQISFLTTTPVIITLNAEQEATTTDYMKNTNGDKVSGSVVSKKGENILEDANPLLKLLVILMAVIAAVVLYKKLRH